MKILSIGKTHPKYLQIFQNEDIIQIENSQDIMEYGTQRFHLCFVNELILLKKDRAYLGGLARDLCALDVDFFIFTTTLPNTSKSILENTLPNSFLLLESSHQKEIWNLGYLNKNESLKLSQTGLILTQYEMIKWEDVQLLNLIENFWSVSKKSSQSVLSNLTSRTDDIDLDFILTKLNQAKDSHSFTPYEIIKLNILLDACHEMNIHTHHIEGIQRQNIYNLRFNRTTTEASKEGPVLFYDIDQPFGFLSNLSEHPIFCRGKIWKTVEHFYQAMKFENSLIEEQIRLASTPMKAKEIAHANKSIQSINWNSLKISVMEEAVDLKFQQNIELIPQLLETLNRPIYEHTKLDSFWGDNGDGSGDNHLGKVIMSVRKKHQLTKENHHEA